MHFDELNSTSYVSVSVPSVLIHGPAVEFWIVVVTEDGVVQESKHHTIGVKPDYAVSGTIVMNSAISQAQGTILRPSVYVTNTATGPIYGTINLLVDGKMVYSEPDLFESGLTTKELKWFIPKSQSQSRYDLETTLEMYDLTYSTSKITFNTFSRTEIIPISEQVHIRSITDEFGNVLARPALLYSSNNMGENFRFQVTAPDGTCIIGSESGCIVKESTRSLRGGLESVEINGQTFRVKYSGPDNPLERFSITSATPIFGNWNVELVDLGVFGQTASAQQEGWIKVKYRTEHIPSIIVSSE